MTFIMGGKTSPLFIHITRWYRQGKGMYNGRAVAASRTRVNESEVRQGNEGAYSHKPVSTKAERKKRESICVYSINTYNDLEREVSLGTGKI